MLPNLRPPTRKRLVRTLALGVLAIVFVAPAATSSRTSVGAVDRWSRAPAPTAIVAFRDRAALKRALARYSGRIVRTIPALGVAEILPEARARHFASAVSRVEGIEYVEPPTARHTANEPALIVLPSGTIYQWQYAATRANAVPESVQRAASAFTIAVVDTGADVTAPDIAAKRPVTRSVVTDTADVRDTVGHGTFVTALAAGSVTNGEGIAGFGGDAKLMAIQASRAEGAFSDFDEAAAIVWAVDRGARIINLSLGGQETSSTERAAIDYAVKRGVLLIAAVGNEYADGNPVQYPAALLQPVGSHGRGGVGLAVGASDASGSRAPFSNTGTHVSMLAPGVGVFSALASTAPNHGYIPTALPGSRAGTYGYGSGTSFAAPQVAGAAALVWAANPLLTAQQVADILEQTATNDGVWNDETAFGVLDVAAAVERASGGSAVAAEITLTGRRLDAQRIQLSWRGSGATTFRLSVREGAGARRVVLPSTNRTEHVFRGVAGARYSFVVEALDGGGNTAASSAPFEVALAAGRGALLLSASRTSGRGPLSVTFRAQLTSPDASTPLDAHTVTLESIAEGTWQPAARSDTGPAGAVSWTFRLTDPGLYRLRARFAGDAQLRPAVSRTVSVVVR